MNRFGYAEEASSESDLTRIDRNQKRFFDKLVVAFVRINSAPGRYNDPVNVTILRGIVESRCSAEDIYRVVVTAQQTIRSKARNLFSCMTLYVVRESYFQTSPGFTICLDRWDLFSFESLIG